MSRFNAFLFALAISLAFISAGLLHALTQYRPYALSIEGEQHSGGVLESELRSKIQSPVLPNNEHGSSHAETAEGQGTEFWPSVFGYKLKITDSLLVAFTFLLTIFTGLLWQSTDKLWAAGERQLIHLSDTAQQQLRAYINNVSAVISNVGAGKSVEVRVEIKNFGQTPAYNVRHYSQLTLAHFPWTESAMNFAPLSTSTMGPGANSFNLVKSSQMLNEELLIGLLTGRCAYYVEGRVTYVDAFGNERFTNYRLWVGGDRGFPPDSALFSDLHGNDAS
jgi:hypothetical protein